MRDDAERYDLIVVGAGSGGIATANRAASYGARVLLIEKTRLGGTCVNVGCVPKKVMWNAANLQEMLHMAPAYGLAVDKGLSCDWPSLVKARDEYVARLNGIYERNLGKNGVKVLRGQAVLTGSRTVSVDGQSYEGAHILIASGGRPRIPAIAGAELGMSSDGFFALKERPQKVAVIGGGYIGVEMGCILAAMGSEVSLIVKYPQILRGFDRDLVESLEGEMAELGLTVVTQQQIVAVKKAANGSISLSSACGQSFDGFDVLLWAIGREPITDIGSVEQNIRLDEAGCIEVDKYQNTSVPGIYAVGDVTGKFPLTPVAIAAGRKLADRLFGGVSDAHLEYEAIPSVVFSHPPLATVGMTQDEAEESYGKERIKVYRSEFVNMFYALGEKKSKSKMKLVTLLPDEKILGAHVLGMGADEMIQGIAIAVRMGAAKADFDRTVAVHPTGAEEFVLMRD